MMAHLIDKPRGGGVGVCVWVGGAFPFNSVVASVQGACSRA